nr:ABC transporter permease [Bacilli bacterium]
VDSKKQTLTDILLAQLGMYPQNEFLNIAKRAMAENDPESEHYGKTPEELDSIYPYDKSFKFEDLINKELVYYPHDTIYSYGDILESATPDITVTFKISGFDVPLTYDEVTQTLEGNIMGMDLVFTKVSGSDTNTELPVYATFEGEYSGNPTSFRIVKEDGINKIYNSDNSLICQDEGGETVVSSANVPQAKGYQYAAVAKDSWANGTKLKITGIAIAGDDTQFGCLSRGIYFTDKFAEKYMDDAVNSDIVRNSTNGIMSHIGSAKEIKGSFKAYVTYEYDSYKNDPDVPTLEKGYASCLNADMNTSLSSMFSGFSGGLNYFEVDKIYLRSLSGLSVKKIPATGTEVYSKPGVGDEADLYYTFEKLPQSISIYPTSFAMKKVLTDYLDKWNSDETLTLNGSNVARENRDDLNYVDTIETIIAVITTLIDIISVALIIFTSLSLVVSCFMIAVITYISVMERVKEIGIIRSLGGRKKDVTRLFTAENLITGLSSGVIGITFTYLIQLIANLILRGLTYPAIVSLSIPTALIMIGISILLSVLSGAIPSRHASKQDPVVALRTE